MSEDQLMALEYIRKERTFLKLHNLKLFTEMSEAIKSHNEMVDAFTKIRNEIKEKKERKRQILERNANIVKVIEESQNELQKADETYKLSRSEYDKLEQQDAKLRQEKKQKVIEIARYEMKLEENEKEKNKMLAEF